MPLLHRAFVALPVALAFVACTPPPPGIPSAVAGVASSMLALGGAGRSVVGDHGSSVIAERVLGSTLPAADNHLTTLELRH